MSEPEKVVGAILEAAGGRLVSKVRLQKAVYFLEQLGVIRAFPFEYHHYGPYSRELENAVLDAKAFGIISEGHDKRSSDGAGYSVFELKDWASVSDAPSPNWDSSLAAKWLNQFNETSVTVLELAATMHFIWLYEGRQDWLEETKRRKNMKATQDRIQSAQSLLGQLKLYPSAIAA